MPNSTPGLGFPRTRTELGQSARGGGTPQAFGIVKTAFLLRKVARLGGLELSTFRFVTN
jgi:hypothetical protein